MYTVVLLIAVYLGGGPTDVQVRTIGHYKAIQECEQRKSELLTSPKSVTFKFHCEPVVLNGA